MISTSSSPGLSLGLPCHRSCHTRRQNWVPGPASPPPAPQSSPGLPSASRPLTQSLTQKRHVENAPCIQQTQFPCDQCTVQEWPKLKAEGRSVSSHVEARPAGGSAGRSRPEPPLLQPGLAHSCDAQVGCPGELCVCQNVSWVLVFCSVLLGLSVVRSPQLHPGDSELKARLPTFKDFPLQGRQTGGEEGASIAARHGFLDTQAPAP